MNNKLLLIAILFVLASALMYADCDLMALLAKDDYTISEQDEVTGDFNDPFDYFEYLMLMSNNSNYQPPYLSTLGNFWARRKSNDDGYGLVFYREGSNIVWDNENFSDAGCQKFFLRGLNDDYYHGTVWDSLPDANKPLAYAYSRILNESPHVVPNDFDNETARIIMGHARKATVSLGNHPYTLVDADLGLNRTYTFMANGTIPSVEMWAMDSLLVNDAWWTTHPPNNGYSHTQISDSEIFFNYIMYFVRENNGNVEEGIIEALNQTDIWGEDIRAMIQDANDDDEDDYWSNIANFVLSDGESLYLFRNSPLADLRHDLSYIDHGEFYGVKTLDPEGGVQLQQYDLVKLSPDHEPELHDDIFDIQIVNAPDDITNSCYFGQSVSIDGDYAVVGAPYEHTNGVSYSGAAYIYKINAQGVWEHFQDLELPNPGTSDKFGYSVSIDDDYIAVGCPGEDNYLSTNCGAVYRYRYSPLTDSFNLNQLAYGINSNDQLGFSVAVNHGGYVAAGAPYNDNLFLSNMGMVRIYKTNSLAPANGILTTMQTSYGMENNQYFGWAVDINKYIAVAGGPGHNYNGTDSGSIRFIYFNDGTESAFTAPVEVSTRDYYGWDLDLDMLCDKAKVYTNPLGTDSEAFKTGPTGYDLIVGAPGVRGYIQGYNYQGAAYISCKTVINAEETFDYRPYFGYSVAIEEQHAVVGAKDVHFRGAAYSYDNLGTIMKKFYSYGTGQKQLFGCDVAYDAENMIIGSLGHDNDDNRGAVYFFNDPSTGIVSWGNSVAGSGYYEEAPDNGLRTYLKGNYPNPFNPETSISFSLKEDSQAILTVYNMKGQKVRTITNEFMTAGDHSIVWNGKDDNGSDVSSGVYFYKLTTNDYSKINKMILLK